MSLSGRDQSPKELLDAELDAKPGDWLRRVPEPRPGEPELTDAQVAEHTPVLRRDVANILRDIRDGKIDGPVVVMPGSGPTVPTDMFADIDSSAVAENARQLEAERPLRDQDGTGLLPDERSFIESVGPAGLALLASLEGAVDAGEMKEVHRRRLGEMGLSPDLADNPAGVAIDYPFERD